MPPDRAPRIPRYELPFSSTLPNTTNPNNPTTTTSSRTTASNVRRNLFHGHLSRRPTTSSTSTSAETLRLDGLDGESGVGEEGSSDIVVRDRNGEFVAGGAGSGVGLGLGLGVNGEEEDGGVGEGSEEGEDESEFCPCLS